jgi:hypothetical protein
LNALLEEVEGVAVFVLRPQQPSLVVAVAAVEDSLGFS